jgi:hypothetical protein
MTELVLNTIETKPNIIGKLGYKPWDSRHNLAIQILKSWSNNKVTEFLKFPVFDAPRPRYFNLNPYEDIPYNIRGGIYQIGFLSDYIGDIPLKNQEDIRDNYKLLKENPFVKLEEEFPILILAPRNNFASESNLKDIDPVVMCVAIIQDDQYLIPLTQWE